MKRHSESTAVAGFQFQSMLWVSGKVATAAEDGDGQLPSRLEGLAMPSIGAYAARLLHHQTRRPRSLKVKSNPCRSPFELKYTFQDPYAFHPCCPQPTVVTQIYCLPL